ncbi:MAG: hypothetical protein NTV22_17215, partial [bacterium]|nr:hypothetical protein [bacterium]
MLLLSKPLQSAPPGACSGSGISHEDTKKNFRGRVAGPATVMVVAAIADRGPLCAGCIKAPGSSIPAMAGGT